MPGRPLSAAQLQHNRDIAKKGGQATAAKYGGYHFAHAARSARAKGVYTPPPIKAPFAALRAKQAAAAAASRSVLGRIGKATRQPTALARSSTGALPRSGFSLTNTPRKRRPAVR
jgi:hypothetical protein